MEFNEYSSCHSAVRQNHATIDGAFIDSGGGVGKRDATYKTGKMILGFNLRFKRF